MLVKSKSRSSRLLSASLYLFVIVALVVPTTAFADAVVDYDFATPIFDLAVAPDSSLLVADAGAGVVELRHGVGTLVAGLPGVTGIAPIGRGVMWAVTGIGEGATDGKLFLVTQGKTRLIADISGFEAEVNPDGGIIDSNPYAVAHTMAGKALVVDAGGNSLLVVDKHGDIDWVATFPQQFASTENAKNLIGCPDAPPELSFVCDLPEAIPTEAVPTSIAVGPDGAYYVGELTGFPGALGISRVWRIEPGTLHAECGVSPACSVVASGFTSIVDLTFGPDGTLYVLEMDEASFLAIELAFFGFPGLSQGGTLNACSPGSWSCTEVATGLEIPLAVAVDRHGTIFAAVQALIPGAAQVVILP
jgi:hypothetical protein